ncbi:MAG: leucine-rich repeat domain-containing protein [Bacilli bacterium]|nr:leucine-rich repeat domain-containing protein [Bacilli bacterium]
MKKIILVLLLLLSLVTFTSCNTGSTNEDINKIKISIVESTLKDSYYIDDFNITTIKLKVEKNDTFEEINLTPLMIENYPESFTTGTTTLKVKYEDATTTLTLYFIERETYTEGLEFILSSDLSSYQVVNYTGSEKNVIIPSVYQYLPVESIKSYAFNNNEQVETIKLPDTIKQIGANAFNGCTNLYSINLPYSIDTIGNAAFYDCTNLRSITIPKTIQTINEYAFYNVKLVYTDSSDYKQWNEKAFNDNNVYIYENLNLSNIYKYFNMFEYYEDENITILNCLTKESTIVIPDEINNKKVTIIGDYSFSDLTNATNITIGNNVEIIKSHAFTNIGVETITIPSSVKEIGVYAFSGCENLQDVIFNEGLEIIRRSVFSACMALTQAIFPSTLTAVEDYTFQNCYNLAKVYIPKSVEIMGENVFYQARKATLYLEASTIPTTWNKAFNPSGSKIVFNASKENL